MNPWFLMENDKLRIRLNQISDDPLSRDEVSKLKRELSQIENANFWPGPLAPPWKKHNGHREEDQRSGG